MIRVHKCISDAHTKIPWLKQLYQKSCMYVFKEFLKELAFFFSKNIMYVVTFRHMQTVESAFTKLRSVCVFLQQGTVWSQPITRMQTLSLDQVTFQASLATSTVKRDQRQTLQLFLVFLSTLTLTPGRFQRQSSVKARPQFTSLTELNSRETSSWLRTIPW